jgi:SAM-dependent methyltransferase
VESYYNDKLAAGRLARCYDIAPPRVQRYLKAEIEFVRGFLKKSDLVLELGCGYGRVLKELSEQRLLTIGIDRSLASLKYGLTEYPQLRRRLVCMDAVRLAFRDDLFDTVICIQNGISAFHVDPVELMSESLRVTKSGGRVLFSTYSDKFWKDRLEWFQIQADAGLLGEIDTAKTGDGIIFCKDGFSATTVSPDEFSDLAEKLGLSFKIEEVDESSLFFVIDSR